MIGDAHPVVRAAARTIQQWYGIEVPPHRMALLASELTQLGGRAGAEAALERLLAHERDAWDAILDVMTVPESYLFRHFGHFTLLRKLVEARRREGRPCRILSAGCSSGEEAWSAAAVLADVGGTRHARDVVMGWDVSERRLGRARAGRYRDWSARAGLKGYDVHFRREGEEWCAADALRPLLRFERVNLVGRLPEHHGPFDAIFFRNVGIYWEPKQASEVLRGLMQLLEEDGLLLMGPSDPGVPDAERWEHVIEDGIRFYRQATMERRSRRPVPSPSAAPPRREPSPLRRLARAVSSPNRTVRARPASPVAAPPREAPAPPSPRRVPPPPAAEGPPTLARVRALADAGQSVEALTLLDGLPDGGAVETRLWRGILLLSLERPAEAIAHLRQCVFLEPDRPDHRQWLAVAYESVGRTRDADRETRNALELGTG